MLHLQFNVGENRYVLPAKEVIAVIPVVMLRSVPGSPNYVVGLLNYQGVSIPIVDVTRLLDGRKSDVRLSTRIILITLLGFDKQQHKLGLLAEKVTEVMYLDDADFIDDGLHNKSTGYEGEVAVSISGTVRRILIANLFPQDVQQNIFNPPSAVSH
ncbi:MAG: hypothetical protein GXP08_13930 [Gammaproteobacteria bacterium]|nr:hypothetical protein [Gammaproteobacteria bacterium]